VQVTMVRGLVAQIMENLLTNSVYWLDQGLNIESDTKIIYIRDNGPGVDPAYHLDIFKPYFTNRRGGKGLGLYIAAEIAKYHESKLYLSNEIEQDGKLRTFIIELPKSSI
ncbi:sensor histidine kinase, partial [Acinetobacter baumannii]|nr:sensor histidine kinase [Acinetobacter baumannii]